MSRPHGPIRQAIDSVGRQLTAERGGFTWHDVAAIAGVGWDMAKHTVHNMARDGQLTVLGEASVPWARRPMLRYAASAPQPAQATPGADLEEAIRRWADFR